MSGPREAVGLAFLILISFTPTTDRAQIGNHSVVPRCVHALLFLHATYKAQGTTRSAVSFPE